MTVNTALAAISGTTYGHGKPQTVTGFPIHRGATVGTVVFVDLLTAGGAIVYGAQVDPSALIGIQVAPMRAAATDALLWTVADKNIGGWGGRCLAELAFREAQAAIQREIACRTAHLRRRPAADLVAAL